LIVDIIFWTIDSIITSLCEAEAKYRNFVLSFCITPPKQNGYYLISGDTFLLLQDIMIELFFQPIGQGQLNSHHQDILDKLEE
jgi:hypothetical protein